VWFFFIDLPRVTREYLARAETIKEIIGIVVSIRKQYVRSCDLLCAFKAAKKKNGDKKKKTTAQGGEDDDDKVSLAEKVCVSALH